MWINTPAPPIGGTDMKAIVQRFRRQRVGHMITKERAALRCGCAIFVGRDAEGRATTGAKPCSIEHQHVTDRSTGLLREAQKHPKPGRPLVEVCAEVLTAAAKDMGL